MLESAVRFLHLFAALLLLLTLAACTVTRQTQPNVIVIMTDDQPYGLTAAMPNVQNLLADRGVRFENAFATTGLCCPARTTVLRGQYVHNHEVLSNGGPQGGFPKFYQTGYEASTLATWLQGAGYRTALMGKYLNAYPYGPPEDDPPDYTAPRDSYIPPGWGEWFGFYDVPKDPNNTPYRMYGYRVNEDGRARWYGNRADEYQTDVLAERATNFVRQSGRNSTPFFLFLTPTAPHFPTIPAARHIGRFADLQAPRSPAFNEADTSDKPRWVQAAPRFSEAKVAELDKVYRRQAEMLLAVDEMVGALVETLIGTGELQNTYIIFTSDQGFHSGEHRLSKMKLTPYAATSQIPLIIRGPGVPEGAVREQLVLNTDLAPTIAGLVGAPVPEFVDGRTLEPLWQEEAPAWRQTSLAEFWPRRAIEDYGLEHLNVDVTVPTYRAVRSLTHLFVEYTYLDGTTDGELYDLVNDPFELENLYRRTDPAVIAAFSAHAARLQGCAARSCREAEDAAPGGL